MRLKCDDILIRDVTFNDADDFYEYAKSEDVGPNAGWKPIPSLEIARRIISSYILSKDVFAIEYIPDKKMIGTMSIYNYGVRKYNKMRQIGFSLSKDYWNRGIMTKALKMVIDYLFSETDCEIIEIGHHVDNFRSKRVIEKCGFLYDGRFSKYKVLYDGRLIDADFYSMTKEDYERIKRYERIKSEI